MTAAYSLLPISPTETPRRLSSLLPLAITSKTRSRPFAFFLVGTVCILVFLSVSPLGASIAPDFYVRLTGGSSALPFQKKGISEGLYRDLRRIDHRSLVLRPVERTFVRDRSAVDKVPWKEEELLPPPRKKSWLSNLIPTKRESDEFESIGLIRGRIDVDPLPAHTIEAFPRKVDLTRGQGGVGQEVSSLERMMFGSVTTTKRAKQMTQLWTNWMIPRDSDQAQPACLILLSKEEKQEDMRELETVLKDRGLPCVLKQSEHERYEVRVMSMIKEMKDYSDSLDRSFDWFVFGDDDTFWVDYRSTLRMLSRYDPRQEWYIGSSSESQEALGMFGRMAFGGAGVFASMPLLTNMANRWPDCYEQFRNVFGGDEMLTRCAALAKGVEKDDVTTREKGLHQFDIPGDTTGPLQSGWPVLSLHHYLGGGWVHLFGYGTNRTDFEQIQIFQRVAPFLGGDNLFKRYVFGNGKWLLVNGYSITYFEEPLKPNDLQVMEHTWYVDYPLVLEDRPGIPERHGSGPAKQTFYIDDIETTSDRSAVFTYLQADSWDESMPSEQRVRLQVYWDGESTVHA
ncbi:uncharacterized protein JCM6883_000173 [Sporobolomyces salmoneus]|uniref:uncharacterized protein n=1 Tax=Sporobolomyces salmoneus TaxID=183962 RepID=UPI0031814E06